MENQFSQEKLDALIERHLNTGESKFHRIFNEGRRFAKYTELNYSVAIQQKLNHVVFRKPIRTKLYYTVFAVSSLLISIVVVCYSAPFFIIWIGLLGFLSLITKAWNNDENNLLEMNKDGLVYNDVPYRWKNIEKTVILTEVFGRGRETMTMAYLVLGLKTGRNKLLEITDLDLKGGDVFSDRTTTLSHYVEYFKRKSETES